MTRGLILLLLLAAATGCSGATGSDGAADRGAISRSEMGKSWPLKVDDGTLSCEGSGGVGAVVFRAPEVTPYALNGTAKATGSYADIRPIWADDKSMGMGLEKDLGPLSRGA